MIAREQWIRVKEIVGAALECGLNDRPALLDQACGSDSELRAEVESLIASFEAADEYSSPGWQATLSPDITNSQVDAPLVIGPYSLQRVLGTGGMGQVWLAEQTEPVRRLVALKLIRTGFYDPQVTQRFLAERQSLAAMNHPAIAKVFDAGTTAAGQPYLVMEYVDGSPITEFCDRRGLSITERLKLFQLVCEGVQHAHQKAVIHRDLKPSNILVTEIDGKPVPQIIDFGVAKAVSDSKTLFTQMGAVVGTLGYMSPEQAEGGSEEVDTRSDVYSLGVLLYELLAGTLPFDVQKATYFEVLRQMREEDAPRPSSRLRTLGVDDARLQNRRTETNGLIQQLRGDLDSIALKALEKDRAKRYATPSALAVDIEHYLRNEPVSAQAASFLYLSRKYVRRHRAGVVFAASALLLLIGFALSMRIERNRANSEAEISKDVSGFMTSVFKVANPSESRGNSVTARELLDKASAQIAASPVKNTRVQAAMMETMGKTYLGLGLGQQAHALFQRAIQIQTKILGPENPETLHSMSELGSAYEYEGQYDSAEKTLRQTLAAQQKVLLPNDAQLLETVSTLAGNLTEQGKYAEAEGLIRQTLADQQKRLGVENEATLRSMRNLAVNLEQQGKNAEAEKVGREALPLARQALGPDHPLTIAMMSNLAMTLNAEGQHAEAERMLRETLRLVTKVYGPDSKNTLATLSNLGVIVQADGRLPEAEAIHRDELARTLKLMGPEHPDTLGSMSNLAITLGTERKYEESEQLLRKVLAIDTRTLGPAFPDTLGTLANLAGTLAYEKKTNEAIALYEKALRDTANAEAPLQIQAHLTYAGGLLILHRADDALAQLQAAVKLGLSDVDQLAANDDLKPLQGDPRFQKLIADMRSRNAAAHK